VASSLQAPANLINLRRLWKLTGRECIYKVENGSRRNRSTSSRVYGYFCSRHVKELNCLERHIGERVMIVVTARSVVRVTGAGLSERPPALSARSGSLRVRSR